MKKFILVLDGLNECYNEKDIYNSLKAMGIEVEVKKYEEKIL